MEIHEFNKSLERWEGFDDEELAECKRSIFNLYVFARDIVGNKVPKPVYHLALSTENNPKYFAGMENEVFIGLDNFIEKPVITLGKLKFLIDTVSYSWGQYSLGGCRIFNKVLEMFRKDNDYRPLYCFETTGIIL